MPGYGQNPEPQGAGGKILRNKELAERSGGVRGSAREIPRPAGKSAGLRDDSRNWGRALEACCQFSSSSFLGKGCSSQELGVFWWRLWKTSCRGGWDSHPAKIAKGGAAGFC